MDLYDRRTVIALGVTLAVLAVGVPMAAAVVFSERQTLAEAGRFSSLIAAELIRRTDDAAAQAADAFRRLAASDAAAEPCGAAQRRLMRQLDLESGYLQAVGHVEGESLVCSSLDEAHAPIPLGPPDFVDRHGWLVRLAVPLPMSPEARHYISQHPQSGYATVIHYDRVVDLFSHTPGLTLALIGRSSGRLVAASGELHPDWIAAARDAVRESTRAGHVLVTTPSERFDYTALVVVSADVFRPFARATYALLLPYGLGVSALLVWLVVLATRRQLSMATAIRLGIRRGEFRLVYQPVVALTDGRIMGVEALARWRRANGREVPPDVFIRSAEQNGRIQALTRHLFRLAEADARRLLAARPGLHLALNLSAADLHSMDTVELVRGLRQRLGVGAGQIVVEATESCLIDVQRAGHVVAALRATGVAVAIDDFGTGYSSLSYLEQLEVDYLKIDRCFVDTIGTDAPTSHVVPHIIRLGRSLGLALVAEGVETAAQADYLREAGVRFAQGWHFGRPLPVEGLIERLAGEDGDPRTVLS
jgi:sensor c-di-GMP phosphodiesterase-like protein